MEKPDATSFDINPTDPRDNPTDTVSSISWRNVTTSPPTFAVASWDSYIRLYQVDPENKTMDLQASLAAEAPSLCANWHEDMTKLYAGLISNEIQEFDIEMNKECLIGRHSEPVKDVFWMANMGVLCSVSFDKMIRFWDVRQSGHIGEIRLKEKPICSDFYGTKLALGLTDQKVTVIDITEPQNMKGEVQIDYVDSPLGKRSPLNTIKFFADGSGIGMGTVEGRCNIAKLGRTTAGFLKLDAILTWKSHKFAGPGEPERLYHVNAIDFNNKNAEMIHTAGGEGKIFFWNSRQKMKTVEFDFKRRPCTRIRSSPDGNLVAYAVGYDWARGISEHMTMKAQVCVHVMKDEEFNYREPTHIKYGLQEMGEAKGRIHMHRLVV